MRLIQRFYDRLHSVLAGCGAGFMTLVSTRVSMANFSPRHRGFIIGVTTAFFFVGPCLFSIVYVLGFSDKPVSNFFLCLSFCVVVVNILAILFVRTPPLDHDRAGEEMCLLKTTVSFNPEQDEIPEAITDRFGVYQFIQPPFQLLMWALFCGASVQVMYVSNTTTYIHSYSFGNWGAYILVVAPVCAALAALSGGLLSDKTYKYTSRLTYLLTGTTLQATVFALSAEYGDYDYIFIITTLVLYSNAGQYWCIVPTLTSEYFGLHHFSRNWGLMLMVNALLSIGVLAVFGVFYDAASVEGSTSCFGLPCFRNSYLLAAGTSVISAILLAALWLMENKVRSKMTPS